MFYKEMQHMFRRYGGDRGDSQCSSQTNSTGELVAELFTKQLFPSTTKAITLFFCYECFIFRDSKVRSTARDCLGPASSLASHQARCQVICLAWVQNIGFPIFHSQSVGWLQNSQLFFAKFSTFFQMIFLPNYGALGMVLRGIPRLGMVTTCLPKARDGHHMCRSTSNQVS